MDHSCLILKPAFNDSELEFWDDDDPEEFFDAPQKPDDAWGRCEKSGPGDGGLPGERSFSGSMGSALCFITSRQPLLPLHHPFDFVPPSSVCDFLHILSFICVCKTFASDAMLCLSHVIDLLQLPCHSFSLCLCMCIAQDRHWQMFLLQCFFIGTHCQWQAFSGKKFNFIFDTKEAIPSLHIDVVFPNKVLQSPQCMREANCGHYWLPIPSCEHGLRPKLWSEWQQNQTSQQFTLCFWIAQLLWNSWTGTHNCIGHIWLHSFWSFLDTTLAAGAAAQKTHVVHCFWAMPQKIERPNVIFHMLHSTKWCCPCGHSQTNLQQAAESNLSVFDKHDHLCNNVCVSLNGSQCSPKLTHKHANPKNCSQALLFDATIHICLVSFCGNIQCFGFHLNPEPVPTKTFVDNSSSKFKLLTDFLMEFTLAGLWHIKLWSHSEAAHWIVQPIVGDCGSSATFSVWCTN